MNGTIRLQCDFSVQWLDNKIATRLLPKRHWQVAVDGFNQSVFSNTLQTCAAFNFFSLGIRLIWSMRHQRVPSNINFTTSTFSHIYLLYLLLPNSSHIYLLLPTSTYFCLGTGHFQFWVPGRSEYRWGTKFFLQLLIGREKSLL